ncbi:ATPase AAA [Bacteroidia bacterium]|nr:ATPase AAA [Bacteroidia bacterium]
MKELPIGIQSFEELRSGDFLYVDKTKEIHQLTRSHIVFLSRPRRFGKSLLISTLGELYKGNKSLFEGLHIYDKWDWTKRYPVIRIDWTSIKHDSKEEMERSMSTFLKRQANVQKIKLVSEYASDCFAELIESLHRKKGNKVVVLIDEYDKPILDAIGKTEAADIRAFLQGFYVVLKGSDDHLKFVFMTGVTKVAKVSIFSALNSLEDITLDERYASICGYTQEELERDFSEHIDNTAVRLEMTREDLLAKIRKWYDGYTWDGKTSLYNPFSTLPFFKRTEFSNYWFETGTPTFLINRLKKSGLAKTILEPVIVGSSAFDSYDPDALEDVPLLFQTGYLTVKNKKMTNGDPLYTLEVPNMEVKKSLMEHLLNAYTNYPLSKMSALGREMLQQILAFDVEGFTNNMRKMLADVPYTLKASKSRNKAKAEAENAENEARYHIIFQLWMTMLGFNIQSEKITNRGRIDAVLLQDGLAIVAELKYHATTKIDTLLDQAIAQIREKRYYEPFIDRKVILLGIAFSGKDVDCRLEQLTVKQGRKAAPTGDGKIRIRNKK